MKDSTMFIIFGVIVCLIVVLVLTFAPKPVSKDCPPPVIRYHCDDDTDTTKGTSKGVLTNCKPVVIERRM